MTNQTISLILVDDDSIFRLGLSTALANYEDIAVINQGDTLEMVLEMVIQQKPNLVIAESQYCESLREKIPDLVIFLLSNLSNAQKLQQIKELGVKGYAKKGIAIAFQQFLLVLSVEILIHQ